MIFKRQLKKQLNIIMYSGLLGLLLTSGYTIVLGYKAFTTDKMVRYLYKRQIRIDK